jgi:pilus assembly protein CpaB
LNRKKAVLIIALFFGAVASGITFSYVKNISRPLPSIEKVSTCLAVTARQVIPARTRISDEMVYLKEYPDQAISSTSYKSLDEVIGRVTKIEIFAGEPVISEKLVGDEKELGLTLEIPKGMRAVTIKANEIVGVAGFVMPGDRVDVLGTFKEVSKSNITTLILQDVLVLAAAQSMEKQDEKARIVSSVTLAVTPRDAQKVILAEETGLLRLVMRSIDDSRVSLRPVSSEEIISGIDGGRSGVGSPVTSSNYIEPAKRVTSKGSGQAERSKGSDSSKQVLFTEKVEIIRGTEKSSEILTMTKEAGEI